MANSVNFIDGLDGLAAGIVAIGAGAFFVYSHQLGVVGNIQASNAGPLIAVIAIGLCVGFLPHNFHPAKIFMGDAGAMLLGVLVAASTLAVVGQDSYQFSGRTYFFFAPIIIPFFILGIPLLDTVFAVVRRAGQRTSPAVADLSHLHHRLMRLGHGHRAAVLILWAWTALLSGLVLWPGVTDSHNEIPPIAVGALAILLYTLFAPRGRSALSNGDNDGHVGNGTNGHGSQPPAPGPSSRVTAPTPKVGASRRTFTGKPPSPVPGRGVVATGGIGSGAGRLGAQNPRSSNGVRLVLPDRPTPPAGQPAAGTPALGTPKTVAPGPPVPEGALTVEHGAGRWGRAEGAHERSCSVTGVFRSLALVFGNSVALANGMVLLRWQDAVIHQRPSDERHRSRRGKCAAGRRALSGAYGVCRSRDAQCRLSPWRVHSRVAGGPGSRDSATVLVRRPGRRCSRGRVGHQGRAAAVQPLGLFSDAC